MGNSNSTSKGKYRLLLLGLDAAGKTTVLQKISGKRISAGPTIGFNVATIKRPNGKKFIVWDVGGQEVLRSYWRHYYRGTSAIVFVVDSADEQRFENARREIASLLREDELSNVPLLVIANKQDSKNALDSETIKKRLDIEQLTDRIHTVLPASAMLGTGMDMCLEWLGNNAIPISKFSDIKKDESKKDINHENKEESESEESCAGSITQTNCPLEGQSNHTCNEHCHNTLDSHSVTFDSFEERLFEEHEHQYGSRSYSSVNLRRQNQRGMGGRPSISVGMSQRSQPENYSNPHSQQNSPTAKSARTGSNSKSNDPAFNFGKVAPQQHHSTSQTSEVSRV